MKNTLFLGITAGLSVACVTAGIILDTRQQTASGSGRTIAFFLVLAGLALLVITIAGIAARRAKNREKS